MKWFIMIYNSPKIKQYGYLPGLTAAEKLSSLRVLVLLSSCIRAEYLFLLLQQKFAYATGFTPIFLLRRNKPFHSDVSEKKQNASTQYAKPQALTAFFFSTSHSLPQATQNLFI